MITDTRKAFENHEWAQYKARVTGVLRRDVLKRRESGKYLNSSVESHWQAWAAGADWARQAEMEWYRGAIDKTTRGLLDISRA